MEAIILRLVHWGEGFSTAKLVKFPSSEAGQCWNSSVIPTVSKRAFSNATGGGNGRIEPPRALLIPLRMNSRIFILATIYQ
jgi:hypothetical protein